MTRVLSKMLLVLIMAFIVGLPVARAEGGDIRFSGSIVVPTCSVTATDMPVSPARPMHAGRQSCGAPVATDRAQFVLTMRSVSAADRDPLIRYYADRVAPAWGLSPAMLAIQTYE